MLACNETGFFVDGEIYLRQRKPNQGQRVVHQLCQRFYRSGRNITFDRFFTSIPLARSLLERGQEVLGTVRKNKRELPPLFVASNRPEHFSLFGYNDGVQIVSSMALPKKCVIMVSIMHSDNGVELDNKEKPHAIRDYNATKCPVDRIDQMANTLTTRRKTRRWPMTIFFNILGIAAINSYISWLLLHPTWHENERVHRRSIFLKELACSLMEPWIRERPDD